MIQKFIEFLNEQCSLNAKEKNFVAQKVPVKTYSKKEFLLEEGQISKAFYYNLSGFVQLYYNQVGNEKTAYFYPENCFISAYTSFVRQTPSRFYLQALEPTTVAVIGIELAQELLKFSPKFEMLARIAMEEELMQHQEIVESLLTLTPQQRYENLLERTPDIFQRASQKQISSFIGIQPESLSRIKKKYWNNT